jgi:hypothetical protein
MLVDVIIDGVGLLKIADSNIPYLPPKKAERFFQVFRLKIGESLPYHKMIYILIKANICLSNTTVI